MKSLGLGGAVIEFPAATARPAPIEVQQEQPQPAAPAEVQQEQPQPAATLDLLKHLPDGHFKTYVGDVARMCNIYPSTSLLVGLGIVSSVACRAFAVAYQNEDLLPAGEYTIAGGVPGDGKSRMLKTYQKPIFDAQKAAVKAWNKRKKEHEESPEWDGKKFKEPYPAKVFVTDTTTEALEPILAESGGYFALASAEQAVINTLTGASYGGEGRKTNNDLPLKGFNGETHSSSRATRSGYTGTVVGAITCFAQPTAIETILGKSEGSGLAERFLMVSEPTQQGTRDHTRQYFPAEYSQNVYNRIVGDVAKQALENPTDFDELQAYRISKEDWRRIYEYRNTIEPHLADGGKYSTATMRGVASKVDMHIMKIAALLSCLYDQPIGVIDSQFITAAIGIMGDMLEYTLSLLFKIGVIGFDSEEESIISYLSDKKSATRRQVQQGRHRNKPFSEAVKPLAAITKTIDRLIQKGVIGESEEFDGQGNSKGKLLRMIA